MTYYLFEDVGSVHYTTVHSAITATGAPLFFGRQVFFPEAKECYVDSLNYKPLADRLFSIGGDLLLSERATALTTDLAICHDVGQITAYVRTPELQIAASYKQFHSTRMHDVLDRERANLKFVTDRAFRVVTWVIKASLLPPFDLFYARPGAWLVTERFAERFQTNGLTGCVFTPLIVSE